MAWICPTRGILSFQSHLVYLYELTSAIEIVVRQLYSFPDTDIRGMTLIFRSFVLAIFFCTRCIGQQNTTIMTFPRIPYLENPQTTATYSECIDFHRLVDEYSDDYQLVEIGDTDSGRPLHMGILDVARDFDPRKSKEKGKLIFLINNAIHPGEPCGVDASMLLLSDLLQDRPPIDLSQVVVLVIPMYNVGGALNRNSTTRANQNGPLAYGFRGNARNLDLNRDFIKGDSRNSRSFQAMFARWLPDVFMDTHTSNGADYSYTMTLIPTQKDKLHPDLAAFQQNQMLPYLYDQMQQSDWEMCPYVYAHPTPDHGIYGFLDYPRYSSGYAALFQCLSFMPETHMLKPYADRVESTKTLLWHSLTFATEHKDEIIGLRQKAFSQVRQQRDFVLDWQVEETNPDTITFKGYKAGYKKSQISGKDRLYYDQQEAYAKKIPFFNNYTPKLQIEAPKAYIVPQAYGEVIDLLRINGVQMNRLPQDTAIQVEMYRIRDFKDRAYYEGHYLHHDIQVDTLDLHWQYRAGDYYVPLDQNTNGYIVSCLEPQSPDSYFAWNFFDGILMQKEGFSAYVFEDRAVQILDENPELRKALETKKNKEPDFAANGKAQLQYIYKNSHHYEKTHRMYPVGRVIE